MRKAACAVALLALHTAIGAAQPDNPFPRPEAIRPAIAFWTRVYTEVGTDGGFIHDSEHLNVVYTTLHFGQDASRRKKHRRIRAATEKYRHILLALAARRRTDHLDAEQQRVLALWPSDVTSKQLKRAAYELRFQLGQADRFREGYVRSGTWRDYIEKTLERAGLPRELAVLPHVESSFDPDAYSKVGAAGMWQFTRSTGMRFMRIDHIVDERRDPFLSTLAAVKLLQENYSVLNSWPLAITAYNHGLAGMRRAIQVCHTRDIGVIAKRYTSRTFGFASRNFYAAFLAALDVDQHAERYFGPIERDDPTKTVTVKVRDFVLARTLAKALQVPMGTLKRLNPALTDSIWAGDKFVPKDFELRLPPRLETASAERMASIPDSARYAFQRPDLHHRVRRGDTLSQIARRYHVSLAALLRANGLANRNFIRAGRVLDLPVNGPRTVPTLADVSDSSISGGAKAVLAAAVDVSTPQATPAVDVTSAPLVSVDADEAAPDADEAAAQSAAPEAETPAAADTVTEDANTGNPDDAGTDDAALDTNGLAAEQADLGADPSDYSVADDGTIEVQALETLGHYAEWLQIKTQRLRDINGLPFGRAVVLGQKIRLDFSQVDRQTFEKRRVAYQVHRQESFFSKHQIANIEKHIIKPGESLWLLAHRTYNVPIWLLQQFNPDLDLDKVSPGTVVNFPLLQPVAKDTSQVSTSGNLG